MFDSMNFDNAAGHFRAALKDVLDNIMAGKNDLVAVQLREANGELRRMENAIERDADDVAVVKYLPKLFKYRRDLELVHWSFESHLRSGAKKEDERPAVELTGYAAKIRSFAK